MSWPSWHLMGEPLALVKYVLPAEVGQYLRLPGPSDTPALTRLAKVYASLRAAKIEYSDQEPDELPEWQRIRPPVAVLRRPGHGTCLDLAIVMAGACIEAGLHPMIAIVESSSDGDDAHALVLLRLEESPLDLGAGWWTGSIDDASSLVMTDLNGPPRPLVAVDPVGFSRVPAGRADARFDSSLLDAVARGGAMLIDRPGRLGVDVGRHWRRSEVHDPATWHEGAGAAPAQWTYQGGQGRHHFDGRAHGRQTPAWRRDMFVGREAAVERLLEHVRGPGTRPAPMVVTGPPGSGKSSVLSRAVIALEDAGGRGVAVHGHDASLSDVVTGVAKACGVAANSEAELLERLLGLPSRDVIVAVDALDEFRTNRDRLDAARLLCELAAMEGVRVIVASRSLSGGGPEQGTWRRSDLVRELFSGSVRGEMVIDLDSDFYFSPDDLRTLVKQILSTGGMTSPEGRSGAHVAYTADAALLDAAAGAIQARAERNYLMATLLAAFLASGEEAVDPRRPGFDPNLLPATIGDTLRRVLTRLDSAEATRTHALLVALSYGRGSGLTDARWVRFARALGHSAVTETHIEQLRGSAVADYLETTQKDGRTHSRLFHRALADHLRHHDGAQWDEQRLCDLLRREADECGWSDGYVRRFLPSHVLAAGRCEQFLESAEFLTACYPSSVGPVAASVPILRATDPAAVFRLALPYLRDDDPGNIETLEMAARTQGATELGARLGALSRHELARLVCVEALPSEVPNDVFLQHAGAVNDVCRLGPSYVVTASDDCTARVWDPYDRESPMRATFTQHDGPVWTTTTLPWGARGEVVVTGSEDGTVRVWDPSSADAPQLTIFQGHQGPVRAVATLAWPGVDFPVVVSTSDDGTARIWNPHELGCPELACFDGHRSAGGYRREIRGVAVLDRPGLDAPVVVTTSEDGTARTWDPHAPGCPEIARFDGHNRDESSWVRGPCAASWPGLVEQVVITAGGDSTARAWRPTGDPAPELMTYRGHRARVRSVFTLPWDEAGPAFATCGDDGTVRLWRPDGSGGAEDLGIYDAHPGNVTAGVYVEVDGRSPVIVTCSEGGAHVWDPHKLMSNRPAAHRGHGNRVRSAVVLTDEDALQPLVITSSNDGTARVWETRDGLAAERGVFSAHADWVRHLAVLPWPGRDDVIASASGDGTVRVWDPRDLRAGELARFDEHSAPVRTVQAVQIAGVPTTLLLSAGADRAVRLWNPYGRVPEEYAVLRHPDTVRCAIAFSTPDARPVIVAATGDEVHVWDLDLERAPSSPIRIFRGHTDWVRDLTTIETPGGTRVCSVSNDRTLRIWDPFAGGDDHELGTGHDAWIWGVTAAHRPDGPLVITTSGDGTVRFWRGAPGAGAGIDEVGKLQLVTTGLSVRCQRESLVVTTTRGFVLYELA